AGLSRICATANSPNRRFSYHERTRSPPDPAAEESPAAARPSAGFRRAAGPAGRRDALEVQALRRAPGAAADLGRSRRTALPELQRQDRPGEGHHVRPAGNLAPARPPDLSPPPRP